MKKHFSKKSGKKWTSLLIKYISTLYRDKYRTCTLYNESESGYFFDGNYHKISKHIVCTQAIRIIAKIIAKTQSWFYLSLYASIQSTQIYALRLLKIFSYYKGICKNCSCVKGLSFDKAFKYIWEIA